MQANCLQPFEEYIDIAHNTLHDTRIWDPADGDFELIGYEVPWVNIEGNDGCEGWKQSAKNIEKGAFIFATCQPLKTRG
jgi:hypothetical protein